MSQSATASHPTKGAVIKVVGVGGGGSNAINTMISSGVECVDFVAINTDTQSLSRSLSPTAVQVGKELTKGLGAGADPDVGRDATLEDRQDIIEAVGPADMVFVTAGMGGGTGTGGAAVVAQIARELGALTVAVVTQPFRFEGRRRARYAELGIERLRESVDTLIVIPNEKLLQMATADLSLVDAFKIVDRVLLDAVRGISDIINIPGTINVDFADVKAIMSQTGQALMAIGNAAGEGRATAAARQAISSPLLHDVDIEGATGVLINITAPPGAGILELNEACSVVHEVVHEDANIIMGAVIDEQLKDDIRVTVIVTGFPVMTPQQDTQTHSSLTKNTQKSASFHQDRTMSPSSTPRFAQDSMVLPQKPVLSDMKHSLSAPSSQEDPATVPAAATEASANSQTPQAPSGSKPQNHPPQETPIFADVVEPHTAPPAPIASATPTSPEACRPHPSPQPQSSSVSTASSPSDSEPKRVGATAHNDLSRPSYTPTTTSTVNTTTAETSPLPTTATTETPSQDTPSSSIADDLTLDIERSIDEAMLLAGNQLSSQDASDIEVPTFLRGQIKPPPRGQS